MGAFENIDSIIDSITEVRAWQANKTSAQSRAAQFDEDRIARLGEFTRMYPKVPAGILMSFVEADLAIDSPSVQAVTRLNYFRDASMPERGQSVSATMARRNLTRRKLTDQDSIDDINQVNLNTDQEPRSSWKDSLTPGQRRLTEKEGFTPENFEELLISRGIMDSDGMLHSPVNNPQEYMKDGMLNVSFMGDLDSRTREDLRLFTDVVSQLSDRTRSDVFYMAPEQEGQDPTQYAPVRYFSYQGRAHVPSEPGVESVPYRDIVGGWLGGSLKNIKLPGASMPNSRTLRPKGSQIDSSAPVMPAGIVPRSGSDLVREASMVGNLLMQEGQGQVRNIYGALHGKDVNWSEPQSDYLIAHTTGMSAGTGLLVDPESEVARERFRREQERGLIAGHVVTPGRWLADALPLTADSTPWNFVSGSLDFAAQVVDPSVMIAKGISKGSAARRLFEADEVTGLFKGVRQQFHGPTWDTYTKTPEGTLFKEVLANESDAYQIWKKSKIGNTQLTPEQASELAVRNTPDAIDDYMRDVVGSQIRNKHMIDTMPIRIDPESAAKWDLGARSASTLNQRLNEIQMLPAHHLDSTNKQDAATNLDDWLNIAGADDAVKRTAFDMVASSSTKNGIEQAAEYAMQETGGILHRAGVESEAARRQMTQLFSQSRDRAIQALLDDISGNTPIRDALLNNGHRVQDLDPHLTMEYLERFIPLPDINRIKRVTSNPAYRWMLTDMTGPDIGKPRLPMAAAQSLVDDVWKPAMLLGRAPAWIMRVVGEEQLRLAFTGLDGIFNHPLSAISIMIGQKAPGSRFARFTGTPTGNAFEELLEHEGAITAIHDGNLRRVGATRSAPTHYLKSDLDNGDNFRSSWADQIALRNYDPVSNHLLNNDVDTTIEWLTQGKGRRWLTRLREAEPAKFRTNDEIRSYLTETLMEDVRILTNNNADLLDAMRTGKLGDVPMFRKGGPKLNREYVNLLDGYLDDAPTLVKGFEAPKATAVTKYRNALDWLFAHSMSAATNIASRSPAFRQLLWRETGELLPYARYDVVQEVLANAEQAGLSNRAINRLKRKATVKGNQQIQSIEELENLAAGYALDETKNILYDLSRRGNLAESFRVVSPFLNAWQEMITTWGNMMLGPQVGWAGKFANVARASRRVQQVIEGGRDNGMIAKNEFGEDVFVFPFSEAFTKQTLGVPIPMTGRIKGLSMVTDVWPSLGPVAAVPVAWMLDGKPNGWRDLYDQLLPYGAPGERDPNQALSILSFAPSWIQKLAIATSAGAPPLVGNTPVADILGIDTFIEENWPSKDEVLWDNRAFMNTQKDIMKYLISTGEYDPSTREGINELTRVAKEKAKDLYYIRAAMQFFAPTAPSPEFLVQDQSGQLLAQWAVTEEFYNNLNSGMDMDEASLEVINKYGLDVFSLTIPKTRSATYATPRTREAADWIAANPDIKNMYPGVYGFFAPQGGKEDYSVLVEQYQSGDVDVLTPNAWLNLRNDTLKTLEYNYYKNQVGNEPTDEEEAWLRGIRSELEEAYPSSTAGILDKPDYEELIPELQAAAQDPKLKDTEVGEALNIYFHYRDEALAYAEDAGYASFQRPNAMFATREWLSGIALGIIEDYPAFKDVWSYTLSREFEKELR